MLEIEPEHIASVKENLKSVRFKGFEMDFVAAFVSAFAILFAIMDPFASIPLYLSLTKKMSDADKKAAANNAVIVAAVIAFAFLFFGMQVLDAFGVTLASFKVFGGFVLALLALESLLGFEFRKGGQSDPHVASVIIATPMLTGPGVMTAVIVLSVQFGLLPTAAAAAAALLIAWLILTNSLRLQKAIGSNTIEVASKVMALLLGAVGIELIRAGITG